MKINDFKKDIDCRLCYGLIIVMVLFSAATFHDSYGLGPRCDATVCDHFDYDCYGVWRCIHCGECNCDKCNNDPTNPVCMTDGNCDKTKCQECTTTGSGCSTTCTGCKVCGGTGQFCCGSGSIPGDQQCCFPGEDCCFNSHSGHFCAKPCEVNIIDCNSCAKSQEENYKCPGCFNEPFLDACANYTYREYTDLKIKGCDKGCSHDMGYEICYNERRCVDGVPDDRSYCQDGGANGLVCVPDCTIQDDGTCKRAFPELECSKCETGGETIDTYPRYTCKSCSDK